MTKKHFLTTIGMLLLVALLVQALPAGAQLYDPDKDLPKPTGLEKSLTKLGRGLSNVLLGWAEIPVTFNRNLKEGKPLGYLVGVSPVMGIARAAMRTGTGIYEMATFPFSNTDVNFDAVLEPEYIF